MKKKILLSLLLTFVLLLCGCSLVQDDSAEYNHVGNASVVIAGKHANSNNFTPGMQEAASAALKDSVTYWKEGSQYHAQINVAVIINDGRPTPVSLENTSQNVEMHIVRNNRINAESAAETSIQDILTLISSDELKATEEGTDLLAAVNQAYAILRDSGAEMKNIVILDTGLTSGKGYLNMSHVNIQDVSPKEILDSLDPGAFVSMDESYCVTMLGLGNVCTPQRVPSNSVFQSSLESLWTEYFERCGCTLSGPISFTPSSGEPMLHDENDPSSYPYVPPIIFRDADSDDDLILFNADELGFLPQSAEFRDPYQAERAIEKSVGRILTYLHDPANKLYVVASVAMVQPGEKLSSDPISHDRMMAVSNILVDVFGVNPGQIVCVDAGNTVFSWRDSVEFPDGKTPDPQAMSENRVVALFGSSDKNRVGELRDAGYLG